MQKYADRKKSKTEEYWVGNVGKDTSYSKSNQHATGFLWQGTGYS